MTSDPGAMSVVEQRTWLRVRLSNGEALARDVIAEGAVVGLSEDQLTRRRKEMGVVTRRIGHGRGAHYRWRLPGAEASPVSRAGHGPRSMSAGHGMDRAVQTWEPSRSELAEVLANAGLLAEPITGLSPIQMRFLCAFAERPIVSHACRKAGIGSRGTPYDWQTANPAFAAAWMMAKAAAADDLEGVLWDRATVGSTRHVVVAGELVEVVDKPSDRLLALLAMEHGILARPGADGMSRPEPGALTGAQEAELRDLVFGGEARDVLKLMEEAIVVAATDSPSQSALAVILGDPDHPVNLALDVALIRHRDLVAGIEDAVLVDDEGVVDVAIVPDATGRPWVDDKPARWTVDSDLDRNHGVADA